MVNDKTIISTKDKKNSLSNLAFLPSFFNDEIREGFYIPEMMKRYWAGQLKVLSEISKVCEKYNISWVADYGSLIGAVRHGGYIPWDDDFDICMLRHDYERFVDVAPKELPKDYQLLTVENQPEYDNMIGRVLNWNEIRLGQKDLDNFFGCPYTVGVDIFVMDGVSSDKESENKRIELAKEIVDAINYIDEGKLDTPECRRVLANIERQNHVILHRKNNLKRELILLSVNLYKRFSSDNSDEVVFAPSWINHHDHKFPKRIYNDCIFTKFENTEIKISALYEEMLKIEYGEYMKIYRAGGVHDYPLYKEQQKILEDHIDGKRAFRYTFPADLDVILQENTGRRKFTEYIKETVGLLKTVSTQLQELYRAESYDVMYQLLEECQPMAISLGGEIENRSGDHKKVIALLEKYCEQVYICHESMADGTFALNMLDEIESLVHEIEKTIEVYLKERKKKILFLPSSPMWWSCMEQIYKDRESDQNNECTVVPIPCYQKNLNDEIIGNIDDIKVYPQDIVKKTLNAFGLDDNSLFEKLWTVLNFEKTHYDEIVIQFPFDGWNRSMTIPPQFCSGELIKHTDMLTYCPCLVPVFPKGGDTKLYESLKTLVEQPTVVYSDVVLLHSEQEKEAYRSIADELTDGKYTRYWNEKFLVMKTVKIGLNESEDKRRLDETIRNKYMTDIGFSDDFQEKKIILYHIGISSLLEHKDCAISRLRETISEITGNGDRVKCIFSPNANVSELEHIDSELWNSYKLFIEDLKNEGQIYLDDKCNAISFIDIIDGYYGDGDEVAHRCRNMGIPVMIRKVDLDA